MKQKYKIDHESTRLKFALSQNGSNDEFNPIAPTQIRILGLNILPWININTSNSGKNELHISEKAQN